MSESRRQIAHLDLDCFFVSVERIDNPALRGKPVVVGGSPQGRGVVASASYEARAFGVRSAMPTAQALRLCPHLVVVRGRHHRYGEVSEQLYQRMLELSPLVERASIDEMYLDFTGCEALYGNDLPGFIGAIQRLVREEFQLPCSIALASTKTLAKIAVGTVKPEGVCVVNHGDEERFLAPLSVAAIPGVGKKTEQVLRGRGYAVIADMQRLSQEQLVRLLGAHGTWLYAVVHGGGNDSVATEHSRKSMSREETFGSDTSDRSELERALHSLVEDVCAGLRAEGSLARTIGLKLRYANFETITRARTVQPTNDDPVVFGVVRDLFRHAYDTRKAVRLLGVHLSQLTQGEQLEFSFDVHGADRGRLLHAVDAIRSKFGDTIIHIGKL